MNEPAWVSAARKYIGLTETAGAGTTPTISRWLVNLKAWWQDDATPWCGVFAAECMKEAQIALPKVWYRALGWLDWGVPILKPVLGCVVVYVRVGGGHVGFVVGKDVQGRIMTLGGNQGDKVSIVPFDPARVAGYRWPLSVPLPTEELPLLASNGVPVSHNEA